MTIHLTPELEKALAERAHEQGTTAEVLALEALQSRFLRKEKTTPEDKSEKTMADFLADYIGVLHSGEIVPGGARMSEDCGKKFADGLLEKHRRNQS